MTKLKNILHFNASLPLRRIFVKILCVHYTATPTTAFNELSAWPKLHHLEKDPTLISDNKPGLFYRIAALLSHTVVLSVE